jgi:nitroimidazol reductase NimA-like FMN-containing flavoprotein (pyridoxamine 5'-phosphate oxidase superfamily)
LHPHPRPLAADDGGIRVSAEPDRSTSLAAEIERLSRVANELEALDGGADGPRREAAAEIRRQLDRIEAALELHLGPPPASSAAPSPSHGRTPIPLDPPEIDAILRRNCWGVLATAAGQGAYAVPVIYGYDGSAVYMVSGPGRKLAALQENPAVCFTVAEVEAGGARWRSVVLHGEARPVEELLARIAAFNVLRRQVSGHRTASARDVTRLTSVAVVRIAPAEITGRMNPPR